MSPRRFRTDLTRSAFSTRGAPRRSSPPSGSRSFGIKLNSSRYESQQVLGLSGALQVGVADDVTLLLGSARIKMPAVHVTPVGSVEMLDCYGLLGRTVLDLFAMWFDYRTNTVAFRDYDK